MRDLLYFIGSLAGAAVLTALAIVVPPESLVWRVVLYVGIAVFVAAAIGILIDMFAPTIAVSRKLRLTVYGFLFAATLVGAGWFYLQFPKSLELARTWFPPLMVPKSPSAPLTPKKLGATVGKAYYKCKADGASPTPEQAAKEKADFQSYIAAWANLYGFKPPQLSEVPGGYKAELVPNVSSDPSKRTFQIVRVGKELMGFYSADYSFSITSNEPMPPNSPLESYIHKVIEGLAKVEPGGCELQ